MIPPLGLLLLKLETYIDNESNSRAFYEIDTQDSVDEKTSTRIRKHVFSNGMIRINITTHEGEIKKLQSIIPVLRFETLTGNLNQATETIEIKQLTPVYCLIEKWENDQGEWYEYKKEYPFLKHWEPTNKVIQYQDSLGNYWDTDLGMDFNFFTPEELLLGVLDRGLQGMYEESIPVTDMKQRNELSTQVREDNQLVSWAKIKNAPWENRFLL